MSDLYKSIARRFPCEIINERNLDLVDEVFGPDFVDHAHPFASSVGMKAGRAGIRQFVAMMGHAFPDMKVTIKDEIDDGDVVVQRNVVTGTHKGEFMGIPPTEKPITWQEVQYYRVRGGSIVERWVNVDEMSVLQELGAIPSPEAEENKRVLSRLFEEAINGGNLDVVDEVLGADCVYHGAHEDVTGTASLKRLIETFRKAFPDLRIAIDSQIASNNKVVTRFTAVGTHESQLNGERPSGKSVNITGVSILHMADGVGVEGWGMLDSLGAMRQMGLVAT